MDQVKDAIWAALFDDLYAFCQIQNRFIIACMIVIVIAKNFLANHKFGSWSSSTMTGFCRRHFQGLISRSNLSILLCGVEVKFLIKFHDLLTFQSLNIPKRIEILALLSGFVDFFSSDGQSKENEILASAHVAIWSRFFLNQSVPLPAKPVLPSRAISA